MFKNKIVKVLMLLFVLLALITTCCFATNPIGASDEQPISTEGSDDYQSAPAQEQDIHSDDLYLFGDHVAMDQLVDGNVYIFANSVSVTGQVNGNLFVCAGDFSLNDAYVRNSIFLFANKATINGACTDLYAACNSLDVSYDSYIARDSRIGCDTLVFKGLNTRNMFVDAENIDFGSESETATIYGNLQYTTGSELSLAEGIVTGETQYNPKNITDVDDGNDFMSILSDIVAALVFSIVVYYLIRWFTPKFEEGINDYASTKIIFAFLIGLAALVVVPIVAFILLFSSIASGLAVALFTVYALLISIAFTVFSLFITKVLQKKITKLPEFGLFVIVTVVLALLRKVPYVAFPVSFIMGITGFGIIVKSLFHAFPKAKNKAVETTVVENKD